MKKLLLLLCIGFIGCSVPSAEYIEVEGKVIDVKYFDKGGFGGMSKTIIYFEDGTVIPICYNRLVKLNICQKVKKVTNKICDYDEITDCE